MSKELNFIGRVGIARLIAFGVLVLAIIVWTSREWLRNLKSGEPLVADCSHLAVEGVDTQNSSLCLLSTEPCTPEQHAYEECIHFAKGTTGETTNENDIVKEIGEIAEQTVESINEQLEKWKYCEVDADCATFYADCPFGCAKAINQQYVVSAQQLIRDWIKNDIAKGNPQCIYDCVAVKGVKCENQQCVAIFENY